MKRLYSSQLATELGCASNCEAHFPDQSHSAVRRSRALHKGNFSLREKRQDNTWIEANASDTVVVFIHGILSCSDACWRNPTNDAFWPDLVAADPTFNAPSVFICGYPTGLRAGEYEVYDAAREIVVRLGGNIGNGGAPLNRNRLVFVCHSQGGIVVRQMLCSHTEHFADKKIGLVLCGSPSFGSRWAKYLKPIAKMLGLRQALGLEWECTSLVNLDRDFLNLRERNAIPGLCGTCLVETRGLWGTPKLVSAASASRYFRWDKVPNVTHGQLVKPGNIDHTSHVFLRDFFIKHGFANGSPKQPSSNQQMHGIPTPEPLAVLPSATAIGASPLATFEEPVLAKQVRIPAEKDAAGAPLGLLLTVVAPSNAPEIEVITHQLAEKDNQISRKDEQISQKYKQIQWLQDQLGNIMATGTFAQTSAKTENEAKANLTAATVLVREGPLDGDTSKLLAELKEAIELDFPRASVLAMSLEKWMAEKASLLSGQVTAAVFRQLARVEIIRCNRHEPDANPAKADEFLKKAEYES